MVQEVLIRGVVRLHRGKKNLPEQGALISKAAKKKNGEAGRIRRDEIQLSVQVPVLTLKIR